MQRKTILPIHQIQIKTPCLPPPLQCYNPHSPEPFTSGHWHLRLRQRMEMKRHRCKNLRGVLSLGSLAIRFGVRLFGAVLKTNERRTLDLSILYAYSMRYIDSDGTSQKQSLKQVGRELVTTNGGNVALVHEREQYHIDHQFHLSVKTFWPFRINGRELTLQWSLK